MELHTYACTACGGEWTTSENKVYCPRCYQDGGWQEILIYVEKDNQPKQSTDIQTLKQFLNHPPLELDGSDVEYLLALLNKEMMEKGSEAKALLDAGQENTIEYQKLYSQYGKIFQIQGKFQQESWRREAIATARMNQIKKGVV